ncbi:MAG: hypothetical protein EBZ50_12990, partial [Alphaproteobacteria bacterium]|nr:hypothetical protein [Alphaproteobacteria bacterium]
ANQGASKDAPAEKVREAPDFGGVVKEYVEVDGVGPTRGAAVDDALRLAVKQVNGVAIDASESNSQFSASIATSLGDLDIASASYAQEVATRSKGLISDFKVISESKETQGLPLPGKKPDVIYKVRIGANIQKFRPGESANRPRVVIALPRTAGDSFDLGGQAEPSSEVAADVRRRIAEALTGSNRFAVLDREFTSEIESELDLIGSGAVASRDTVRLGEALAADLIVIPVVERYEYKRIVRKLRMADRELVSYAGGARFSFRVVNSTTRQIVLTQSYTTEFPTTQPTTLGASVDVDGATSAALRDITGRFVSDLLARTFPVAVISMDGPNVVLSQGEGIVRPNARYRAVLLGAPLVDPQTGQSLGRAESEFGTVLVTRISATAAYGVHEGPSLSAPFKPGIIELRQELPAALPPVASTNVEPARTTEPSSAPSKKAVAPPAPSENADDKW